MECVIGIDSSTQSTKATVVDIETGREVASGSAAHVLSNSPGSQQHPDTWWNALVSACAQLGDHRQHVIALSVAGQQHGLVLLDEADQVIRPAILWNDLRPADVAMRLALAVEPAIWTRATGSVPVTAFTISKLAWLGETEPESVELAQRVMLPHDWTTWRLSGEHVTDRGDASGTGWFDPTTNTYNLDLLAQAVDNSEKWVNRLPRVLSPTEAAGSLTPEAAAELGLPAGIAVGAGTGDNMAGALGLGLSPGDVCVSLGTSGTVFTVSDSPAQDPSGLVSGFADATGRYLPLVCTNNATRVTDKVAEWLSVDASTLSTMALSGMALSDSAPSEGDRSGRTADPILIPHLVGERFPDRPDATGTWFDLTLGTSRAALARSAHDAVLCSLLEGRDHIARQGIDVTGKLRLIGGGKRSPAYQQRCADLSGEQIIIPEAEEIVALGAAVQATATAKDIGFSEIANSWGLGIGTTVDPHADGSSTRRRFREYMSLV